MTMISCVASDYTPEILEFGYQSVAWAGNVTFDQCWASIFKVTDHPPLNDSNRSRESYVIKDSIRAKRLVNFAKLKLRGTTHLQDHLKLDIDTGCVEIFHHVKFLKEHLAATMHVSEDNAEDDRVQAPLKAIIPRQLALEVVDSIQKILFPFGSDSEPLLQTLISKEKFDPDCRRYGSSSFRGPEEADIKYHYFGTRLMDLYEEVENPGPRTTMEKWLERVSNRGGYNVMIAFAGFLFALLLGVLGLAVAIFQAWVAWYAWKYPVPEPDG